MSAEVFYRAIGLQGDWVVDVWESRGGVIEVLVEPPRGKVKGVSDGLENGQGLIQKAF